MSDNEKRVEESDKIVNIVEKILQFNRQNQDKQRDTANMPELKSEKSDEQRRNQEEQGLKKSTPNQK